MPKCSAEVKYNFCTYHAWAIRDKNGSLKPLMHKTRAMARVWLKRERRLKPEKCKGSEIILVEILYRW